jgi:tRNA-intron endonuclease, archaea type
MAELENVAHLFENKAVVDDSTLKGTLVDKGFGENKGRSLVLDLFEAVYLSKNSKLNVVDKKSKIVGEKKLLSLALEKDKRFYSKFLVYSDLREKGYCVKTGLKFGFDFRVYPKGKKMGEEHSKYVIHVAPESEKLTMPQLSRMTRLSGNIHTIVLVAVIDSEDFVNYYSAERVLL